MYYILYEALKIDSSEPVYCTMYSKGGLYLKRQIKINALDNIW